MCSRKAAKAELRTPRARRTFHDYGIFGRYVVLEEKRPECRPQAFRGDVVLHDEGNTLECARRDATALKLVTFFRLLEELRVESNDRVQRGIIRLHPLKKGGSHLANRNRSSRHECLNF
jgi:hypothetical protein